MADDRWVEAAARELAGLEARKAALEEEKVSVVEDDARVENIDHRLADTAVEIKNAKDQLKELTKDAAPPAKRAAKRKATT